MVRRMVVGVEKCGIGVFYGERRTKNMRRRIGLGMYHMS